MEQFFRDPIWQFVGVAISLVALAVAVIAIRFQQQRKSVGYNVSDDHPVFYLFNDALKERLQVTLDGVAVQGLRTIDVVFFNEGNVPVLPTDYVSSLRVAFPASVRVLAAGVKESTPEDLGVSVYEAEGGHVLSPALINPGDELVLQFLLEP